MYKNLFYSVAKDVVFSYEKVYFHKFEICDKSTIL